MSELPGYRATDDPHDPSNCGFHRAEDFQREPESSKGHYAVGAILFWLIVAVVAIAWGRGAFAQNCQPREMWIAFMAHKYELELRAWGLDSDGRMLELLTGEKGFAILTTTPDRCTTAVMTDRHYSRLGEMKFGPGSKGTRVPTPNGDVLLPPPLSSGHPV